MADTFAALSVATTNSHDDAAIAELPLPVGMVLGENQRPAFEATDSAALNFFFSVVPDVEGDELLRLLEAAWNEDAPTALRLIFQTGNVREGGKMDRDNFHRCLLWLWEHKPETVLLNLRAIPTHTCLKDLLSLLTFAMHSQASGDPALALEGALAGKRKAKEHKAAIRSKAVKRQRRVARRDRRLSLKEAFAATLNQPLSALLLSDEPAAVEGETATPSEGDAATPNAPKEGGDSTHPKGEGGTALPKFSKVRWVSPAVKFEWDASVR
ncbi:hypothetical protein T484DRAFT_1769336 [Baffinella frigidus]|nr:hypothetical protein T484DRAFT_1769336 [Cryptophyta sp. CCMP2293]